MLLETKKAADSNYWFMAQISAFLAGKRAYIRQETLAYILHE
jgi:hypothetical protein